jgi:hypothetical protein
VTIEPKEAVIRSYVILSHPSNHPWHETLFIGDDMRLGNVQKYGEVESEREGGGGLESNMWFRNGTGHYRSSSVVAKTHVVYSTPTLQPNP